jgi:hypothetical protein
LGICILLAPAIQACKAEHVVSKPSTVHAKRLAAENIRTNGVLAGAHQISDRNGEHILVLTRKASSSLVAPQSGRIERIDLVAAYYLRVTKAQWKEEWVIRDVSDCPGLDVDGDFFMPNVTFTDLNKDGTREVTVPYLRFHAVRTSDTDDAIDRLAALRRVAANAVSISSWDPAQLMAPAAEQLTSLDIGEMPSLSIYDGSAERRHDNKAGADAHKQAHGRAL